MCRKFFGVHGGIREKKVVYFSLRQGGNGAGIVAIHGGKNENGNKVY